TPLPWPASRLDLDEVGSHQRKDSTYPLRRRGPRHLPRPPSAVPLGALHIHCLTTAPTRQRRQRVRPTPPTGHARSFDTMFEPVSVTQISAPSNAMPNGPDVFVIVAVTVSPTGSICERVSESLLATQRRAPSKAT